MVFRGWVMKKFSFLSLIFLVLVNLSFPQAFETIGIERKYLDPIYESQKAPMWCWAACISMALRYYSINITQEDIVYRVYGTDYAGRLNAFAGGSADIITRQLNNWIISKGNKIFIVSAQLFRGSPNHSRIVEHLKNKNPIIVAYGPTAHNGHVVLLTAVNVVNGSYLGDLYIRDPDPTVPDLGRRIYANFTLPYPVQWVWLINATER